MAYRINLQITRLETERDAALREVDEQARLLGMGSEREARLMAERDRAFVICDRVKDNNKRAEIERDALSHNLGELLATLHGDGGHYRAEHGDDKATEDAIIRVQRERMTFRDLLAVADACIETPGQRWEYNATVEAARELRKALTGKEAG